MHFNILQVILIGTLLSYPSLALRGGVLIHVSQGYPTIQNVCHWSFLTYKHALNVLQVILIGTLLSYPSLALGGGVLICVCLAYPTTQNVCHW